MKINQLFAMCFVVFLTASCSQKTAAVMHEQSATVMPAKPAMATSVPEAIPKMAKAGPGISSERLARYEKFLEAEIAANKIPGAVSLIKRRGQVVHSKAFGVKSPEDKSPMSKNELFYIQSMTKPIVSVAFMMLYEEGHFQLTDPISKYIPEFKDMKVATSHNKDEMELVDVDKPITIIHALSHTTGLSHGLGLTDLEKKYLNALYLSPHKNIEDRVKALAAMPLIGQPGEQWYYSASPDILALLIEKFSGMSCAEFLQTRIFDPLGMSDTGYNLTSENESRKAYLYGVDTDGTMKENPRQTPSFGHKIFGGTHGLFSSAGDYMKFCEMLLNGGKADGKIFLSRKTLELMTSNFLKEGLSSGQGQGFGLGFGINKNLADSGIVGSEGSYYWGGAYNTYFYIDPEEEMIGILMMQFAPYTNYYADKLRQFTYQAIID